MPRKPPFPSVSKAKTRTRELAAMKAVLARAIDDTSTPPRELPALVRRHIEVSELLEDVSAREADAADDERRRDTADEPFRLEVI